MVRGVKDDSSVVNEGPFNTIAAAMQFGDDQVASGYFVDYTITYTDAHGNTVEYQQT